MAMRVQRNYESTVGTDVRPRMDTHRGAQMSAMSENVHAVRRRVGQHASTSVAHRLTVPPAPFPAAEALCANRCPCAGEAHYGE